METKTNDADTKGNAETIAALAGPHVLLTLVESLISIFVGCMYVYHIFYSKHYIIAHAHIKFYYFILVNLKTGPANPSIKKFIWSARSVRYN